MSKQIALLRGINVSGKNYINNQFFEKKLRIPATTRNWKTVNALLALATKSQ